MVLAISLPLNYIHRMEEIWRPVQEVGGLMEVSNLGRVRTIDRDLEVAERRRDGRSQGNFRRKQYGRVLSPCVGRHGYLEVALMVNSKRKKYRVHRLVAAEFVPGYFEDASIDHLDGDKLNNRADNLEWVTLSENTRRQWETGLVNLRGERHPSAKLTNLQSHAIVLLYQHNFPPSQLAEWFGVSTTLIYKLADGRKPVQGLRSRRPTKRAA
jgi:hypothetical protein